MNFQATALIAVLSFSWLTTLATSITGLIYDKATKRPLPGATVVVKGTTTGVVTDENGRYMIDNLDNGTYILEVSSLGYQKSLHTVTIKNNESSELMVYLEENVEELKGVLVTAKSESRRISEQPITVASINTQVLKAEATNTIGVLTRAAGVRVRQSGGLGSNAEIQLNGLTGNAVRQYYDGIPLELLGGGIQLNNIPVNAIDRIDIYKGVMPIDIGTDALAGGINVVPKEIYDSYLDASYEFGSFNTHVLAVNGAKATSDRFFVAFNGFFNYSDNNYDMRNTPVARFETFTNTQGNEQTRIVESVETVERFHNQHQSSFGEIQVGMNHLKWADRVVLSTGFSQRFDQIQHGARVTERPTGEVERDSKVFFQNIQYEKNFNEKFRMKYFGNYAIVRDGVNDSTQNLYNWSGEIETAAIRSDGTELLAEPSLREGRTFVTVHRLTGEYNFLKNYSFNVSNFYAF